MLQPIEVYKGKVIFYSLGNFAFDLFYGKKQTTGVAHCIILDKVIQEVSFMPALINEVAQPMFVDTEKGSSVVGHMETIREPFCTSFTRRENDIVVQTGVPA